MRHSGFGLNHILSIATLLSAGVPVIGRRCPHLQRRLLLAPRNKSAFVFTKQLKRVCHTKRRQRLRKTSGATNKTPPANKLREGLTQSSMWSVSRSATMDHRLNDLSLITIQQAGSLRLGLGVTKGDETLRRTCATQSTRSLLVIIFRARIDDHIGHRLIQAGANGCIKSEPNTNCIITRVHAYLRPPESAKN